MVGIYAFDEETGEDRARDDTAAARRRRGGGVAAWRKK
eukprot:gene9283-5635_t